MKDVQFPCNSGCVHPHHVLWDPLNVDWLHSRYFRFRGHFVVIMLWRTAGTSIQCTWTLPHWADKWLSSCSGGPHERLFDAHRNFRFSTKNIRHHAPEAPTERPSRACRIFYPGFWAYLVFRSFGTSELEACHGITSAGAVDRYAIDFG